MIYKIIIIGDGGVGKTASILRFARGFFSDEYVMTIGVEFLVQRLIVGTNKGQREVALQLWDMGGQERFASIRSFYYLGAKGAIIVFDLTRRVTFDNLPGWIKELRGNAKDDLAIILVGNKKDLDNSREVDENEAIEFAKIMNCEYIETSAKTGENVDLAYKELLINIMSHQGFDLSSITLIEKLSSTDFIEVIKEKKPEEVKKEIELINLKVEEILKSTPNEEEGFRFLIIGDESLQKPLLAELFSVEKIRWPPQALNILYTKSNYKINIGPKEFKFHVYFLSNIRKLKENFELFNEACKQADGIIIFYNPTNRETSKNAADMGITLRNYFPELEIILTTGSEDVTAPFNLELERFAELEKLEMNYNINNYDDHESLLSEMLINVLKRKKKLDHKKKFMKNELKKYQEQLSNQKADPHEIMKDIKEFIQIMEGANKTKETENVRKIEPPKITPKNLIFISYSHKDIKWLERVQIHLKPLEREGKISRWDDTLLKSGEEWREKISQSLNSSKVAVLLISPNYLASDFIAKDELPPLLKAANSRGTVILPLIISPSRFESIVSLSRFQAVNNPRTEPLMKLNEGDQDEILVRLSNAVEDAFK